MHNISLQFSNLFNIIYFRPMLYLMYYLLIITQTVYFLLLCRITADFSVTLFKNGIWISFSYKKFGLCLKLSQVFKNLEHFSYSFQSPGSPPHKPFPVSFVLHHFPPSEYRFWVSKLFGATSWTNASHPTQWPVRSYFPRKGVHIVFH